MAVASSERQLVAKRDKLDDEQIVSLLRGHISAAQPGAEVERERADSLDYYQGRMNLPAKPGQSAVTMRDCFEVVEWIKPELVEIFMGGDEVVNFTPFGPEDVKGAQQDSDYTNLCVMHRNDGFEQILTWMSDGLILKNGYIVAEWQNPIEVTEESYEDLTVDQITQLLDDGKSKILSQKERPADPNTVQMPGEAPPGPTFDISIRREVYPDGRLRVFCVPPERALVPNTHPSLNLDEARFCGYWEDMTISEIRELGYEIDDEIGDEDGTANSDPVSHSRNWIDPIAARMGELGRASDPTGRTVRVYTVWVCMDVDGDGIAERRKMVLCGSELLSNEIDNLVAMSAWSPILMAHRHVGIDILDVVKELQEIKTALMRGSLTNMYLSVNGRYAVDEDRVSIDDMLTSRPGGVVRVSGDPSTAISPLVHPTMGVDVLRTIEYLDGNKEERTGVSRLNQGLDANTINKTMGGQAALQSAGKSRVKLIARVFAETGMKRLFLISHAILRMHQRKTDIVKLRGEWVPVNPGDWRERRDASPAVGLGTGNSQQRIGFLQMQITAQQGVMPLGLAGPENIYESLVELSKAGGYKDVSRFWKKPQEGAQPPQQPQDPAVMAKMADIQLQREKLQIEAQTATADRQAKIAQHMASLEVEQATVFTQAQAALAKDMLDKEAQTEQAGAQRAHDAGQKAQDRMLTRDTTGQQMAQKEREQVRTQTDTGQMDNVLALVDKLTAEVQELRAQKKPKGVKHHYDENGRIIGSEAIH